MSSYTAKRIGSYINGTEYTGKGRVRQDVRSPYSGDVVGTIDYATSEDVNYAIDTAHSVFHSTMKTMPAHKRAAILRTTATFLERDSEWFAQTLAREAGKPIRDARGEVGRAVQVLQFAADEAKSIEGKVVSMDAALGGESRVGLVIKRPIGVVGAITPFNFPLNLVLHKVAPALAAGNTVVLKPAEKTPLTAVKLAQLFEEAGLPKGALNVIMGTGVTAGTPLVTDPRVDKITFTGSMQVGIHIKQQAGLKKVTLELGSNSPNLVFEDADLHLAVQSLVKGAFAFSGQVCISVQRIYVQRAIYQAFVDAFVPLVKALTIGDPTDETTDLSAMITEETAIRAKQWIDEAVAQGATALTGGIREKNILHPTVLVDVTPEMKVVCQEVFAPIVSVIPFDTEEEALNLANDSSFGLQAGVFTKDLNRAFRLAETLETGGVWINEISTYRQDNYPYGGVKLSGTGKEGVPYAVEEMLNTKFVGFRLT